MGGSYYDVVIMGMETGPLVAGALLAQRGFRVVVVGQKQADNFYLYNGYRCARKPHLFTSTTSPAIRRVVEELSLTQLFSHLFDSQSPVNYQVVSDGFRVDVYADTSRTRAEIVRELDVSPLDVDMAFRKLGRLYGDMDRFIQNDMVFPAETFFERRELSKAQFQNPFFIKKGSTLDDFVQIEGELRQLLEAPVQYSAARTDDISPFLLARTMGGWLFDVKKLKNGKGSLRQLLCDRIMERGGDVLAHESVRSINVKGGKVKGVSLLGMQESIATSQFICDLHPAQLCEYIEPSARTSRFNAVAEDAKTIHRYGVNLGVDAEVVPVGMEHTVFVCGEMLAPHGPLRIELVPQDDTDKAVLNVSCYVPPGEEDTIRSGALRDNILDEMRRLVPFLDNHLKIVHSTYDGLDAVNLTSSDDCETTVDPTAQPDVWLAGVPAYEADVGVEGIPYRTGIKGLVMAGEQVVAGLADEGAFVSGWGAAKIAGKMDPSRQKIVRTIGLVRDI